MRFSIGIFYWVPSSREATTATAQLSQGRYIDAGIFTINAPSLSVALVRAKNYLAKLVMNDGYLPRQVISANDEFSFSEKVELRAIRQFDMLYAATGHLAAEPINSFFTFDGKGFREVINEKQDPSLQEDYLGHLQLSPPYHLSRGK